ncbi:hypothetical protein B0H14DRAFT_2561040 [Mycena olivaceomarginata]|nr:hypothetical protein B0H14DRAFT_2561040 [Mycena olivaceomarginata]
MWSLEALTCLSLISFGARNTVQGLSCLTVDKHGNSLEAEDSNGPLRKYPADGRLEIFLCPIKLDGVTSKKPPDPPPKIREPRPNNPGLEDLLPPRHRQYQPFTKKLQAEGSPTDAAEGFWKFFNEFGYYGGRSTSSSREGLARTSRTFTEFAKGVAWSKVLVALK